MHQFYPKVSFCQYPRVNYFGVDFVHNEKMDIYEIRRLNLIKLIDEKCNGSDAAFARAINKDASYITRCKYPEGKAGKKRISDAIISATIAKFDLPVGWMDISDDEHHKLNRTDRLNIRENINEYSNAVSLPLLNISASMGAGENNYDEIVVDMLRVSKSWINKTLSPISDIRNLSFIHAIGDSMSPTFGDGDILLVDSGIKNVTSDSVYVIEAHERLFIKRVRRRLDGKYEISSDNPAVKTVDTLNGNHQVTIKGRVVWVWNGRKV